MFLLAVILVLVFRSPILKMDNPCRFFLGLVSSLEKVNESSLAFDRPAEHLVDRTWFAGAELINEVHVDHLIGMAEMNVFTTRRRHGQACGSEMRFARQHERQNLGYALHGFDDKRNAKMISKRFHEVVLGTRRAVEPYDVGRRTVTCDDT